MTIENSIHQFIRSTESRLSQKTTTTYLRNLKQFESWYGSKKLLQDLTNFDIENFQIYLREEYTEATQNNFASALRRFAKYWYAYRKTEVAWELIKGPRIPEKLVNFITEEKFSEINNCLNEDEYYQLTKKLIFHLLWNSGMRIGELLSLNIEDLNSKNHYVHVLTEKSKKLRIVMWNDECHRLLIKYLGVRLSMNNAPELFQTPLGGDNRKRTRLTARTVQRWCKEIGDELGFKMNPHSFRHGKCHHILNCGGSRQHIMTIVGHSDIRSSENYLRLNIFEQKKIQEQYLPRNA